MKSAIVFFDEYKDLDHMLVETIKGTTLNCEVLVLKDEAFLPCNTISIYEYQINKYETNALSERDIFYVFLDIPEYWSVKADEINGAIFNGDKKMATIYFRNPIETRNVQRVEWNTESGIPYKIDYYNRYGYAYSSVYLGAEGKIESREYYTSEHKEVININYSNGVVTVFREGQVSYIYSSIEEYEKRIMSAMMREKDMVIFTSNKQLEKMLEIKDVNVGKRVIALQNEDDVKECQEKQYHQKLNCSLLVFNNYFTNGCLVNEENKEFRICYSTSRYPEVNGNADVLILTASDILYGVEQLVEKLPDVNFHIAANTLVSQKLIDMSARENVYVYPQIKEDELKLLFEKCAIYLDINYGKEIYNAVVKASLNNMLILGYDYSLHNKFYLLDECIFKKGEDVKLEQKIRQLINDREELEALIIQQQNRAKKSLEQIMR